MVPGPDTASPAAQKGCGQTGHFPASSKENHTHTQGTAASPLRHPTLAPTRPLLPQLKTTVGTASFPRRSWGLPAHAGGTATRDKAIHGDIKLKCNLTSDSN